MIETIILFFTLWVVCATICEYNTIARHFCDEVFWELFKRGGK